MSNYSQTVFFTPKDALPTSDPNKTIFGAAYDVEFGNISTAIATKYDTSTASITLTGTLTAATVTVSGTVTAATVAATGSITVGGNSLFFGVPSSANVTAAVSDVGKVIVAAGNIAINNAVFSQGHAFSIYNNTAGNITINGTVTTMRLAGTATTGNRTLATRGMATIWMNSASEAIVGGPGVT